LCVNQYILEIKIYAYELILTHKKRDPEGSLYNVNDESH